MEGLQIPNKSLFKVDEVCSITGIKPYVLRFWESEFEDIEPVIGSNGRKMYEHKDIEMIAKVKSLLFDEKLTIQKAKMKIISEQESLLESEQGAQEVPPVPEESLELQDAPEKVQKTVETLEVQVDLEFTEGQMQSLERAKKCLHEIIYTISDLKLKSEGQQGA